VPQTLLFELPASFLESDQFTRVMDTICAVTGPAAQDVIDIVSRLAKLRLISLPATFLCALNRWAMQFPAACGRDRR
jgi:hypothetical protein